MKWLVVIVVVLFACVLSKLSADNGELQAELSRSRAMVKYLLNDRDLWMKYSARAIDDGLQVCMGNFSPCPNGVRGIIVNEPGDAAPLSCSHGHAECSDGTCKMVCDK